MKYKEGVNLYYTGKRYHEQFDVVFLGFWIESYPILRCKLGERDDLINNQ